MRILRDPDDGQAMVRDRTGELVPAAEPEQPPLPAFDPETPCEEHGNFGYRAATCPSCWSEVKGGDRPRRLVGRMWDSEETE